MRWNPQNKPNQTLQRNYVIIRRYEGVQFGLSKLASLVTFQERIAVVIRQACSIGDRGNFELEDFEE